MSTNTTQTDGKVMASAPVQGLRRRPRRDFDEEALVAQGLDPAAEARLKAERVQEMLRAMPQWQQILEGKGINRVRSFPSPEVAMLYGTFVTGFAKAHELPVNLSLCGGKVAIALHARRNRGRLGALTEEVVGFAQQIG